MSLTLSEEQLLLKATAHSFFEDRSPISRMRALRDSEDKVGFSRELWKEMADMGWVGIPFSEEFGGAGMGYSELAVVLEEGGRVLLPEPFISTVLLAGGAVELGASDSLRKELLSPVCAGDKTLAMAFQEHGRFDPFAVGLRAVRDSDRYTLNGTKQFALDAHVADHVVIVARTSGEPDARDGLTLFVVDSGADGLAVRPNQMVDGRRASTIELTDVVVSSARVLGEPGGGAELLETVFDRATIGLCSEMLGTFSEAFERTLNYIKEREQFGVKIGTFQALRHRIADMWCELELARSVVREATSALDEERGDLAVIASAAKAKCSDVCSLITREALQMHGGIGMTDEEDIGLFFKRGKAAELTLGDAAYHRDRYARLRGY